MNEVAVGQIGEIVHRSPQLLRGYYHDEERTKAAFDFVGVFFIVSALSRCVRTALS